MSEAKEAWRVEVYNDAPAGRQQVAVKVAYNAHDADEAVRGVDVAHMPDGWQIVITKLR